jgi:hypothetical protein
MLARYEGFSAAVPLIFPEVRRPVARVTVASNKSVEFRPCSRTYFSLLNSVDSRDRRSCRTNCARCAIDHIHDPVGFDKAGDELLAKGIPSPQRLTLSPESISKVSAVHDRLMTKLKKKSDDNTNANSMVPVLCNGEVCYENPRSTAPKSRRASVSRRYAGVFQVMND